MIAHKFKKLNAVLLALMIMAAIPAVAQAQYFGGFSTQAVLPENQRDLRKTYFDLLLGAGEEQTIEIVVRNGGDTDMIAFIRVNPATTGKNGLIVYSEEHNPDESLPVMISEIAVVETPEVRIPANGEINVPIKIKMPDQTFDGCLLGGIVVTGELPEDLETDNTATQGNTVEIENKYSYTIGLMISQNETPVDVDLKLRSIVPETFNYQPVVNVNLQNDKAAIIKGMSVFGEIFRANETTAIKTIEKDSVDMAPNSMFELGITWDNKAIEPGEYRLVLQATYNEHVWSWDETFTIQGETAREINEESLYVPEERDLTWLWITLAIVGVALFILAFWLGRRTNERRNDIERGGE